MKIFLDSDIIISSLISNKGAAYLLVNQASESEKYISNLSHREMATVVKRLNLRITDLEDCLKNINHIMIKKSPIFEKYVFDRFDAHIVAAAVKAKVRFLITYNVRHYDMEKIKRDLNILVYTPGQFLQYLRSI